MYGLVSDKEYIPPVSYQDFGSYFCRVVNAANKLSKRIRQKTETELFSARQILSNVLNQFRQFYSCWRLQSVQ